MRHGWSGVDLVEGVWAFRQARETLFFFSIPAAAAPPPFAAATDEGAGGNRTGDREKRGEGVARESHCQESRFC